MKYTLCFIFFLALAFDSVAQDTTVVQTLRWSDNFRTDTFLFPNDPGQSWRKIYLVYNMRCRNGATCGEWDYSCNTFITDPSRIDSSIQTFPDYVISGVSGSEFEYAIQPTYSYYRYIQHQATLSGNPVLEGTVGNANLVMPLAAGSGVRKVQLLFTAAELTAAGLVAGNLYGLKWTLNQTGTELGNFTIGLKNTSKTILSADDPDVTGFTEVYFRNTEFTAPGTLTLPFYQPYAWDGTSNLLLEWSFSAPGATTTALSATNAGFDAAISSDQPDYSLRFGSGSYVTVPTTPMSGISTEITVALWSYGNSQIFPANSTIFEGNNGSGARAINVHLPWSNGSVYWDCGGANGGYDRIEKAADPTMYEGQWNHWAFTKNTVTGSMKIYLNGVLWHSGSGKTIPIDFKSLILGGSADHSLSYFGNIDEFQVWDKELDATTIAAWMRKTITPTHPDYSHLKAYYRINEGVGSPIADSSPAAATAIVHLPNWVAVPGSELFKNFETASLRPNTTFIQGNLSINDIQVPVITPFLNAQQQVLHYGVAGTDLVLLDTFYYYPAGMMNVLDPATNLVVDSIYAPVDGIIKIQNLSYYNKRAARFELLSLVTPYGNGLSLGANGKTFTIDVTDFSPVLTGNKVLSVEFGGEWQEDLDIKFVFVKGTPSLPVLNIQNIWPEGRGWYQDILDDRLFEPRTVTLNNSARHFKLRSAVTGHGQNGEFVPRQHYLNIDGGEQEFKYDVWKYCGKNPIYPQGGTWIFDRAGWCPGMATDLHEFRFYATPGSSISLDYGLNGEWQSEANYLVSNQLVSYGAYTHTLDASIEAIKRPNNQQVEYARINPACSMPIILVKNTGSSTITALDLAFQVPGGGSGVYSWTGSLPANEETEIALPIPSPEFWATTAARKVFQVQITAVNNQQDDEAANNQASMTYNLAQNFAYASPLRLKTLTNNFGEEYSYTIKDIAGNVVLSRDQMASNTSYTDILDLPNGCYTLNFEDKGNDGLNFWFFPENGTGTLSLMRLLSSGGLAPVKSFTADFGGGVQFDFTIASTAVGTVNPETPTLLSIYPNPAHDAVTVELHGVTAKTLDISLRDVNGRECRHLVAPTNGADLFKQVISLEGLPGGMYFVRVTDGATVAVSTLMKD